MGIDDYDNAKVTMMKVDVVAVMLKWHAISKGASCSACRYTSLLSQDCKTIYCVMMYVTGS